MGFSLVSRWLEKGGELVFVLTSTVENFVERAMEEIYEIDIDDYRENLEYVEFDPSLDPSVGSIEKSQKGPIKADLVNPDVWDEAIEIASKRFEQKSELGTLVFASALNLLLFSKTYGAAILKRLEETIKEDKTKT